MRTFVTADTHFGDPVAAARRGFASVDDHDAFIVERWNAVVSPDDEVWIIGDVSAEISGLGPVAALNGQKYLIAGNRDHVWHRRPSLDEVRDQLRNVPAYLVAGFHDVYTSGSVLLELEDGPVILTHIPVSGDAKSTRHEANARPTVGDSPVLCGHVHDRWRTSGRQLNVGVDVNDYTPLVLEDALAEARALRGPGGARSTAHGVWSQFGLA